MTRRLVLALAAFTCLLPLSGCGCRRDSCRSNSFAPPPAPCCDRPPAGFVPNVQP